MKELDTWGDCPSGVVTNLAGRLRRRRQVRPVISIGLGVLLLSAVSYGLIIRNGPRTRAPLNCRETVPLLAKYHNRSLDAPVESDVREHLSRCPSCRKKYEEMYPSEARNHALVENRLLAVLIQSHR